MGAEGVIGEDWQLSRRCLTRCFAVLVERLVLSVKWRFSPIITTGDGRYSLPHPLIRSSASLGPPRPTGYPSLVAYNAPLLLIPYPDP